VRLIDIIIPTWNNPEFLNPCVYSIAQTGVLNDMARLIIVNNGKQDMAEFEGHPNIVVLNAGENLGWEGGLKLGLENSKAPYVVFQNDDTFLPQASVNFYQRLLLRFSNENVAAVGPATTVAAGLQSIYHPASPRTPTEASYLIFFCVMVRRAHLDAIGGIDVTLPGGDDFDMSMRLRQAGYNVVIDPSAFIIHHGFKSGTRLRGDHTTKGGWNSAEMSERTNQALIRKHGFRPFIKTLQGLAYAPPGPEVDKEAEVVRSFIQDEQWVLELGCGGRKTVENAVGVDRVPKGEPIPNVPGMISVADFVADVQTSLPVLDGAYDVVIARHILEHCLDTVGAVTKWKQALRPGGKLLVAVPDERVTAGIPLNPEHAHAFSPGSLKSLLEACGFREIKSQSCGNGVSFVGAYERVN
jgi:hypothetical protein